MSIVVNQHVMPRILREKWRAKCLNTRLPLPTQLYTGFNVNLKKKQLNQHLNLIFHIQTLFSWKVPQKIELVSIDTLAWPFPSYRFIDHMSAVAPAMIFVLGQKIGAKLSGLVRSFCWVRVSRCVIWYSYGGPCVWLCEINAFGLSIYFILV